MISRAALAFSLLVTGCASAPRLPATVVLRHGQSPVGTYVSSDAGFATSSYWIEGPTGLVLIDTQFLLSAAGEFVDWAERTTGKKAVLAIVLHPNPDKFNGVGVLKKRGIRVITSEQVLSHIPAVHKLRHGWFYDRFKPDYPNEVTLPDSFGNATTEIDAAGIRVKLHVMKAGCSDAHVVVAYGGHLFPGDLVTNGFHSWLELGRLEEWLERIDELENLEPDYVHPGRGPSGGPELLEGQRAYLTRVIELVRAERPRKSLPAAKRRLALTRLQEKIEEAYPGLRYGKFVELGIGHVWNRLAR